MNTPCDRCGEARQRRSAGVCPRCGAPVDWREPRADDPIDNDDEKVVENLASVEAPYSR
jgi:hypothetical protein